MNEFIIKYSAPRLSGQCFFLAFFSRLNGIATLPEKFGLKFQIETLKTCPLTQESCLIKGCLSSENWICFLIEIHQKLVWNV